MKITSRFAKNKIKNKNVAVAVSQSAEYYIKANCYFTLGLRVQPHFSLNRREKNNSKLKS